MSDVRNKKTDFVQMGKLAALLSQVDFTPGGFEYTTTTVIGLVLFVVIVTVDRVWTVQEKKEIEEN